MGSVLDYIACPNCKTEAFVDYYYKTGEEYINCANCGYHKSVTIINRDKRLDELVDSDWEVKELKNPYGAYRFKYYERGQLGIQKYGRTLDRDDLNLTDWLNHLQEELMDATLYIEKLKQIV